MLPQGHYLLNRLGGLDLGEPGQTQEIFLAIYFSYLYFKPVKLDAQLSTSELSPQNSWW